MNLDEWERGITQRVWMEIPVDEWDDFVTYNPTYSGPLHTDAEVLAEMGGERVWMCWQYGTSEKFQHCRHDEQGMADEDGMVCGWYRVVKEAADG